MLKGDVINGYIILQDFTVAGGMSKISFAEKNGKEFFIKEFLYPKYPLAESPGSEKVKMQKRKACDEFEKHHKELNQKIKTKVSIGGNLVFAIDFFRFGPCYYKITEKIDVATISCNKISTLPIEQILLIAKSVVHSVKILHSLNIVHGDLKPENILIKKTTMGFSGKLIDFDDSYFSQNPPKDRESLVGTPEYYSPEQALYILDEENEFDGKCLTCKSDIFTLGIIFCEYFTGKKPLLEKYDSMWKCVIEKDGSYRFGKLLPPNLKKLINNMLKFDCDKRPSISEVFDALKDANILETIPQSGGLRGLGLNIAKEKEYKYELVM